MKIVLLSGSPRTTSITRRIALHLREVFQQRGDLSLVWIDMRDMPIPPVQQVWQTVDQVPESYREVYEQMMAADGFVVVSPEYNGSYSPALKQFLDHFPKAAYERKAWGVVTGSTGALGGMRAAQQLLLLGSALWAIVQPRLLLVPYADQYFDEQGQLCQQAFAGQVETFVQSFHWLADRLHSKP